MSPEVDFGYGVKQALSLCSLGPSNLHTQIFIMTRMWNLFEFLIILCHSMWTEEGDRHMN